ncbi:MAG TPA: GTPase RsgA, partial [Ilumatobacteraceae bacterium]|nr:GTPase RsgA [Ilumatobacteraceae bacterium]
MPDATLSTIDERCDIRLGWSEELDASWQDTGLSELPGRVTRLDRGWSTVLRNLDDEPLRMRNIGADVAVGDWIVPSVELDRIEVVLPRRSAFVRRASFEGSRAESQTIAANIDVVMLVHALTTPPNQRRLERELVLAWDSGARPVVVLTKRDLVDDPAASVESLHAAAPGVTILTASGISGEGVDALAGFAAGNATIALL